MFRRALRSDIGQSRPLNAALSARKVTAGAAFLTEQRLAVPGISAWSTVTASQGPQIGDNLPDLGSIEKSPCHGRSGNTFCDGPVQIRIGTAMEERAGREIRPQAAFRASAMAGRAVRSKDLRSCGLIGGSVEWIVRRDVLPERSGSPK